MNSEHYETLRQEIIKSVPEIVELKYGCKTDVGIILPHIATPEEDYLLVFQENPCSMTTYAVVDFLDIKIYGRPIRLSDLIVAIIKNNPAPFRHLLNKLLEMYNFLDDDLDHQSDELKEWLYQIICREGK